MIFEILRYRLKSGQERAFARVMLAESEPLHARAGIDIVFHGPLVDAPQGYVLVRRFATSEAMEGQLVSFYASVEWRDGPRQQIIDAIETSERMIVHSP